MMKLNQNSIFYHCLLLSSSSVALQLLGFGYRILLGRLAGAQAIAVYGLVMSAYNVVLSCTLTGVALSVSRIASSYQALGQARSIIRLIRTALFLFLGLFCLLGLGLQRLPGVGFSGKLSWGLALVCLVLLGLSRLSRRHRGWKILLRIAQIGLAALVLGLSAVEVWVIRAGHRDESAQPADAVIVLGAGVNGTTPSVALQTRIDAAERYLKAHPDIPAVLSGGQGAGEDISEARAMYDALTDRGIDPERLILEEQSANTRQNLQNSLALLPDDYHKTVAIVTNDFHMGRVRLLLNAAGPGRVVQVPAKLPWWWLSANYYLRESFAVVNDQVVRPLLA